VVALGSSIGLNLTLDVFHQGQLEHLASSTSFTIAGICSNPQMGRPKSALASHN